jgi:hypothetical protein
MLISVRPLEIIIRCRASCNQTTLADPTVIDSTRSGIPVGTQRRFDVYKDVNEGS